MAKRAIGDFYLADGTAGTDWRKTAIARRSASVSRAVFLMISAIAPPTSLKSGVRPSVNNWTMSSSFQLPMPSFLSGVMFGTFLPTGPSGVPARKRDGSVAPNQLRGVWHSPQWASAVTR